ncbi:hypothetical protein AKJ09_04503 [Labilithrix luteola]|uniref:Uncharacterized protein n=1 Tax=Labilithrix luteola TaxID=1391654 RepID=A0A0K1PXG7_9BACT|nr:hypothetical protein AKJ09_04503 [Labilithrix luteola]
MSSRDHLERLGAVIDETGVSRKEAFRMVAAVVFFGLFFAGIVVLSAFAMAEKEAEATRAQTAFAALVLSGLFGSLAFVSVRHLWRYHGSTFAMHAGGIVAHLRRGTTVLGWEDVARWYAQVQRVGVNGVPVRTVRIYRFVAADGREIKLMSIYERVDEFFARIESELIRRKLPVASADFDAGTPLVFGPFVVSRDGISHKTRTVAWTDVETLGVSVGVLRVKGRRASFAVPYLKVANAPILLALYEQIRRGRAQRNREVGAGA